MQIYCHDVDISASLSRGFLSVNLHNKEGKYKEVVLSCDEWLKATEQDLKKYSWEEPAIPYLDDIKKLAEEAVRFQKSIRLLKMQLNGTRWDIRFSVCVNGKISYIDTCVTEDKFSEYIAGRSRNTRVGIESMDDVIVYAYMKIEQELEKEYKILDSLLSINMERDGLRITFRKYDLLLTYSQWVNMDQTKFTEMYGRDFGNYIPMIKDLVLRMIDRLTQPDAQPKRRQITLQDGKVKIEEIPIKPSEEYALFSSKVPFSSSSEDYKDFLKEVPQNISFSSEEFKSREDKLDEMKKKIKSVKEEFNPLLCGPAEINKEFTEEEIQASKDLDKLEENDKCTYDELLRLKDKHHSIDKHDNLEQIIEEGKKDRQLLINKILNNRDVIKKVLNETYDNEKLVDDLISENPILANGLYLKIKEDIEENNQNATECN